MRMILAGAAAALLASPAALRPRSCRRCARGTKRSAETAVPMILKNLGPVFEFCGVSMAPGEERSGQVEQPVSIGGGTVTANMSLTLSILKAGSAGAAGQDAQSGLAALKGIAARYPDTRQQTHAFLDFSPANRQRAIQPRCPRGWRARVSYLKGLAQ